MSMSQFPRIYSIMMDLHRAILSAPAVSSAPTRDTLTLVLGLANSARSPVLADLVVRFARQYAEAPSGGVSPDGLRAPSMTRSKWVLFFNIHARDSPPAVALARFAEFQGLLPPTAAAAKYRVPVISLDDALQHFLRPVLSSALGRGEVGPKHMLGGFDVWSLFLLSFFHFFFVMYTHIYS
jgi:hypothetical protein